MPNPGTAADPWDPAGKQPKSQNQEQQKIPEIRETTPIPDLGSGADPWDPAGKQAQSQIQEQQQIPLIPIPPHSRTMLPSRLCSHPRAFPAHSCPSSHQELLSRAIPSPRLFPRDLGGDLGSPGKCPWSIFPVLSLAATLCLTKGVELMLDPQNLRQH